MSSLVGVSVLDTYSAAAALQSGKGFGLGDFHRDDTGRAYIYVQASAAIAANDVVFFTTAYAATALSTSNDARGNKVGVAPVAFAANEFGWVQVDGQASVNVLANAAANARLNTTATAGKLDDDGGVGSMQVQGIYLTTANGAGTNATAAVLNSPFVDVTL
jgi:hypothetical protein